MAGRFIVPADQVGETIRKVRVDAGFTDIAVADVLQTAPDRFFGGAGA